VANWLFLISKVETSVLFPISKAETSVFLSKPSEFFVVARLIAEMHFNCLKDCANSLTKLNKKHTGL